jgi:hypothetical protein
VSSLFAPENGSPKFQWYFLLLPESMALKLTSEPEHTFEVKVKSALHCANESAERNNISVKSNARITLPKYMDLNPNLTNIK